MNSGEDGVWLTVLKNRKIIFANCLCDSLWETNSSHSINITVTFLGVPGRKSLLPLSLGQLVFSSKCLQVPLRFGKVARARIRDYTCQLQASKGSSWKGSQ